MATSTIKPKRGTTAQWAKSERILEWNEWGIEETVSGAWILRVGDGEHKFLELPKVIDTPSLNDLVAEAQNTYNLFFEKAEAMEDRFEELSAEITSKHETAISDIETKGAETLAMIPEDYTETYNRAVKNSKDIEFVTSTAKRNDKRLTNVEKALFKEPFFIDSSVAYTKNVPENALPYAEVGAVGGITRKCTNLAKAIGGINLNGFMSALNNDGSVTISGSATAKQDTVIQLIDIDRPVDMPANKTYSLTVLKDGVDMPRWGCRVEYTDNIGGSVYVWNNQDISRPRKLVRLYLQFTPEVGDTTRNGTYTVMLNEGTEPLPYETYFEGLRSAPVTEVESVGANVLPSNYRFEKTEVNGITFKNNGDGSITINGTATDMANQIIISSLPLTKGETYSFSDGHMSLDYYVMVMDRWSYVQMWGSTASGGPHTAKFDEYYAFVRVKSGVTVNNITLYPMLNKGSTALPYTPYVRNSLPIPDEVKALDGYGWGVNDEVYNYIDFDKKQFVKRVEKRVLTGTEPFEMRVNNDDGLTKMYQFAMNIEHAPSKSDYYPSLCSHYEESYYIYNETKPCFAIYKANDGYSYIRIRDYFDTAEELKSYLAEQYSNGNPITIFYELSEPVITDISDIITDDNYIGVEGGGTVTMVNEYKYDVPSEVVYRLEEGESA